jgi:hypothetical protein
MKLFEFLKLTEEEQYKTTWRKGAYVDLYLKDNIAIELYAVNNFMLKFIMNATLRNSFIKKY